MSSKKVKNARIKNKVVLEKKHGKVCEVKEYKNGRYGAFFKDGQFRWVGLENKKRSPKKSPKNSPKKSPKKRSKKKKRCDCKCDNTKCNCNMTGGGNKPIDLKTAVKLLKSYYADKYN